MMSDWRTALDAARIPHCRPAWWARGAHRQTILGHLLPSAKPLAVDAVEHIGLDGGDRLAVKAYRGEREVVLYVFHGLGGSADSDYIQRSVRMGREQGFTVYAVNHRGAGEGVGLAREPYHSGRADDLSAVIAWGRARHPEAKHVAVGFSLSGNALLLLQAGVRGDCKPDFAVAVNAPIDLARAAGDIGGGLNRIYDLRFVRLCRKLVQSRVDAGLIEQGPKLGRGASLRDFDEAYTAPAGGFRDREHYYAVCSANQYLTQIDTPTLMLTSETDPFVNVEAYNVPRSEQVVLHIEPYGGHMGYLDPTIKGDLRWLERALGAYLDAFLRTLGVRDSEPL